MSETPQADRQYARMVHAICPSARVYAREAEGGLDLWTVLPERDEEIERAIAEKACEIMRLYPHVDFDWMLVTEQSPSVADLEANGYVMVSAQLTRSA